MEWAMNEARDQAPTFQMDSYEAARIVIAFLVKVPVQITAEALLKQLQEYFE